MTILSLSSGDYALSLAPKIGGGVAAFTFQGEELFRSARGSAVLDSGCFPLVPFSNRIAGSTFEFGGRSIQLTPNHPLSSPDPVLHGFGWLGEWAVEEVASDRVVLRFDHRKGEWPWNFTTFAGFSLSQEGLEMSLSVRNRSPNPMPAGLGFHPYFPRTDATIFHGLHKGEWLADDASMPVTLDEETEARDWWQGQPVASRLVDTAYVGREGPLTIAWPDRKLMAVIEPSSGLDHTVVYVPAGENYFCVEPVSHATDAINRAPDTMQVIAPGECWSVSMKVSARRSG